MIVFQHKAAVLDTNLIELRGMVSRKMTDVEEYNVKCVKDAVLKKLDECLTYLPIGTKDALEQYGYRKDPTLELENVNYYMSQIREIVNEPDNIDAAEGAREEKLDVEFTGWGEKAQFIDNLMKEIRTLGISITTLTSPEYLIPCITPDVLKLFHPFAHPNDLFINAREDDHEILAGFFRALVSLVTFRDEAPAPGPGSLSRSLYPTPKLNIERTKDISTQQAEYARQADKAVLANMDKSTKYDLAYKLYELLKVCRFQIQKNYADENILQGCESEGRI